MKREDLGVKSLRFTHHVSRVWDHYFLGTAYLAGLSNGGLGVSQVAMTSPEQFRGLIFLSPVMATGIVDSAEFHDAWRDRPVLVITGEEDRRIPLDYVTRRVSVLQTGGADVTYITYPGEDHFLFFSQLDWRAY